MRKKKLFKKLIATAGAMVMALTMMMPMGVSAATIDSGTPVTLTIEKHETDNSSNIGNSSTVTGSQITSGLGNTISGVEFTIVKIADIAQSAATNGNVNVSYTLTSSGASLVGGNANDSKMESDLKTWLATKNVSTLTTDIEKLSDANSVFSGKTNGNGQVVFSSASTRPEGAVDITNAGQGLYLVVETDAPATVTRRSVPFLVSLPMTEKVETGDQPDEWIYNVYAYPKNTTGSTDVDKKIVAVDDPNSTVSSTGNTAEVQIGDMISYEVAVTAMVPDEGLTKLRVEDVLSAGLDYDATTGVTVYTVDGETRTELSKSNYSVTAPEASNNNTLIVDFDNYLTTLNNNTNERVHNFVIAYRAKLNENAVLGVTGNANNVTMYYNYNNNPTPETDINGGDDSTKVFTWGIDLTKVANDEAKTALNGVVFNLRRSGSNDALQFYYDATAHVYRYAVDTTSDTSLTTDLTTASDGTNNGKIIIKGLDAGEYVLSEVKTNSGYTLLKDDITITITATMDGGEYTGAATASVGNQSVTMTGDNNSNSALVPLTVVNNKGFDLPQTGAAGTALFAIVGIVLAAVAGGLLFFLKRSPKRR